MACFSMCAAQIIGLFLELLIMKIIKWKYRYNIKERCDLAIKSLYWFLMKYIVPCYRKKSYTYIYIFLESRLIMYY